MSLDFEFDLEGKTEEEIDSGGQIKAGWHHVKLRDVSNDDGNDALSFKYEVIRGPCRGVTFFDRLFNGDPTDEGKVAKAKQRQMAFAKRLGLIDRITGRVRGSWLDAIGREVYVIVEAKPGYDKKTGQENGKVFHNLAYLGIFNLEDARVPDEVRKTGYGSPDLKENKVEKGNGRVAPPTTTTTAATSAAPTTVAAPAGRQDVDLSTI